MVVKRKNKSQVHTLSRSLTRLGCSMGRKNRRSIARQAINDSSIRKHCITYLGNLIRKEIKTICSSKNPSLLRKRDTQVLQSFSWDELLKELRSKSPLLMSLLQKCIDEKKLVKTKNVKKSKKNMTMCICTCAALLLRYNNESMNLVQRIVSILLHNGGASKRVSTYMYVYAYLYM